MRQAEKATSLGEDIAELKEPTAFPDHVEEVAVFAGSRIGPLASGTPPRARSAQPNKHRSSGCVANVSDDPVAADPSAVGEIVAADKFGLLSKPEGKIRCLG